MVVAGLVRLGLFEVILNTDEVVVVEMVEVEVKVV